MARKRKTQTAADVLATAGNGLGARIDIAAQLVPAWQAAVGAEWAERGYPEQIDRGVLIVGVQEPIWIQEFEMMSHEILERLRQRMPELPIKRLRFTFRSDKSNQPNPVQRRAHYDRDTE